MLSDFWRAGTLGMEIAMGKIGIMGGTFDPIHIGHLLLAQCAMEEEDLEEVWFVPTGCSYTKEREGRKVLPPGERYEMARLAVEDNHRLRCLDIESKREGNTYSYETLEALRQAHPGHSFFFIFGADCLFAIEGWKCPERIFANATVIAAVRSGADVSAMRRKMAELSQKYGADIRLLPFRNFDISSTEIRARVREGKSIRYLVPDKTARYIVEKGFYRDEE